MRLTGCGAEPIHRHREAGSQDTLRSRAFDFGAVGRTQLGIWAVQAGQRRGARQEEEELSWGPRWAEDWNEREGPRPALNPGREFGDDIDKLGSRGGPVWGWK